MALLEKPDLLLLDEPTNHLDAETVQWLEQTLREYPGTVIIVTHDRYFLDNITKWILELENGRGLPFEGNYSSWLAQKAELLRIIEKKETQRQKTLAARVGVDPQVAPGPAAEEPGPHQGLRAAGRPADRPDERDDHPDRPRPAAGREGAAVRRTSRKGYPTDGELLNLLEDCSFDLPRGAIVGVIGPNGTGKTTLLRHDRRPGAARRRHDRTGPQRGALLRRSAPRRPGRRARRSSRKSPAARTRIELGNVSMNSRAYVARFNFRGPQQQKKVGECSGGERNRIHLAKMLRRGGNLLLLDEPTNDLDVATMRVLEQALIDFPGCAMVISHDRFFLDRICTHLLVMEGDGKTRWFEGNFAAYEEAVMAENPDRFAHRRGKYQRLTGKLRR